MTKKLWLDMDNTFVGLYDVEGWLEMLRAYDPTPYIVAEPMVNLSALARLIHKAQRNGYTVGIISWLSKDSNAEYDQAVTNAKLEWLERHLPSVEFDEIYIVPYGVPKGAYGKGILFDDDEQNRLEWGGVALPPEEMLNFFRWL